MSQHFGAIGPVLHFVSGEKSSMPSESSEKNGNCCCVRKSLAGPRVLIGWLDFRRCGETIGCANGARGARPPPRPSPSSFQGSVAVGEASPQPRRPHPGRRHPAGAEKQPRRDSQRHPDRRGQGPAHEPASVAAALGRRQLSRKSWRRWTWRRRAFASRDSRPSWGRSGTPTSARRWTGRWWM